MWGDYDETMSAHHQEDWNWWDDEAWNCCGQEGEWQWQDEEEDGEDGDPEEDEPSDDVFVKLQEEQSECEEQRKDMLADNDRNLTEARKAVSGGQRPWMGRDCATTSTPSDIHVPFQA